MPRSLSGVKSGVFDTLEVSETVQLSDLHTSGNAALPRRLRGPEDPAVY